MDTKPHSVYIQILAARLRVTLDQRLGRPTPKRVLDLANQTNPKGSYARMVSKEDRH